MKKVLIVGESWTVQETHVKGFDTVDLGRLEQTSVDPLRNALTNAGIEVEYMPSHIAQYSFPDTVEALQEYSAIALSDIGSNTIMMDPVMQFQGVRKPNRFLALVEYVKQGGGLVMMGGYLSFAGIENKARYAMTPLAEILPVKMLHYDDRMEHPEGICPVMVKEDHPVLNGVTGEWPWFLGYNKIKAKENAVEIAQIGNEDTFMAAMEYGEGRTFAFASDCAMHWGSKEFLAWDGYGRVMPNIFKWLAKEI
ncbi:MAG: cytoplasmic protein [Hespellia sp.]|jgi:uncharacterized membrane protein|nr:cytoplasmic protein [Hespellia sp.]